MFPNGSLSVRNPRYSNGSSTSRQRGSGPSNAEDDEEKRVSQVSASSQGSNWSPFKKDRVGPWILGSDIGRGMVGKVRKVKHYQTGQLAAAKIIPAKQAEAMRAESLMNLAASTAGKPQEGLALPLGIEREVVIMRLLCHDNIVRLFDIWENRGELYLIMELVNDGELFDYISEHKHLEEDETFWIFRQIVVALLNAHRLGIYHRDLKPENILVELFDDEESGASIPQIKLADFGMAALQPKGKMLTTSCGSIHYAAPEVFEKRYDGAKADVWSLGVIFYVMLTGMLPFTDVPGEDSQMYWYRQIKSGRYAPQDWLSPQAQDLISKMLVPNPRHRISLQSIWNHPFMNMWRDDWHESAHDRDLYNWLGAGPPIAVWSIKSERDIEPELFRNLRVLWHSESEEVLKRRLTSSENNLEKYFYAALYKQREEALENYVGGLDTLSTSASDYHHTKPNLDPTALPPLPAKAYERTKSSLSILHDEAAYHTRPAAASRKASTSPSQRSYDPYRSSKHPLTSEKENYSVTVHRGHSVYKRQPSSSLSVKTNSLRVDTLRKEQKRRSTGSNSARSQRTSPSPKPAARRSMSRSSIVTSVYPSSPVGSVIVRPASANRRGVDFSHVRRSSTVSAMSNPSSPSRQGAASVSTRNSGVSRTTDHSDRARMSTPRPSETPSVSPSPPDAQNLLGKLEKAKLRKSKTHSQVINTEARKYSVELEKYCDQVFNRDSTGSSYATTSGVTHPSSAMDTPPSSISNRGSASSSQAVSTPERASWQQKDILKETPNTYWVNQLSATRRNIIERCAKDVNARQNPAYDEVLSALDSLLSMEPQALQADSRRVTSAPQAGSGPLPMITEEEKALTDDAGSTHRSSGQSNTSATKALRAKPSLERTQAGDPASTIRVIEPSSPLTWAPLKIRKTSAPTAPGPYQVPAYSNSASLRYYGRVEPQPQYSNRRMPPVPPAAALDSINEDGSAPTGAAGQASGPTGRRNPWFGSWKRESPSERAAARELSAQRFDPSRRPSRQASAETDLRTRDASIPVAPPAALTVPSKRPGFLSLFSRKKSPKVSKDKTGFTGTSRDRRRIVPDADSRSPDNDSNNSQTGLSTHSNNSDEKRKYRGFYKHAQATRSRIASHGVSEEHRSLGIQRNWLERFFNIKPASQAMCFQVGRGKIRTELVRLLTSWHTYGITDIDWSRESNLIFARVAADNYLRMKEVAFVVQLFVVLENGKRNRLSVARFIQRKGAASSFRMVVGRIEGVLQNKGLIVMDGVKKREMEEMLVG
ncbi:MAG: hypothetical protein Q9159_002429 [Coniocarpon cinnabarinum]